MTIYKPTPGKGFIWGIGLLVFVGLILAVPVGINLLSGQPNAYFLSVMVLVFVFTAGISVYFVWAARNMEYALDEKGLVIKWAFNRKVIPLEGIKGIRRAVGTSSLKVVGASWPGFHMGSFTDPGGKGSVNLFATRLWGDILLIRTRWEIVGITPEEPDKFLDQLHTLVPGLEVDSHTGGVQQVEHFSPWKDRFFITIIALTAAIMIGTGIFLAKTIPALPYRVPMHYNISGEVDRYGAPGEIYTPFAIGVLTVVLMAGITTAVARNNRTSAYLMAFVSLFISLIFCLISAGMVLSAR